ncbi:MAG: ABC transporter ATP-binding protein [bacterium]|nr:ABC transporter ATP-binding protein [bacterium]
MIELDQVVKQFAEHRAVDSISLKVEPGEIFGFLGPNGAGKTTSIRMVTGILPPSSGKVLIQGLDIQKHPIECKRKMGYIPDRPYVYEKLKGWEFLEFMMLLYDCQGPTAETIAETYLERFKMDFARDRLIEDYSHGMKQKLVIVASLLHDPDILVIDEPMVGLDPRGAKTLKEVFVELTEAGKTIFLSTHTMSVAEELCHRISIINHGKILATGNMGELKKRGSTDDSLEGIFLKITEEELQEAALSQNDSKE